MNAEKMEKAVAEAERFLAACQAVRNAAAAQKSAFVDLWNGSRETGAMRRASLDLTRALAELRKS